ncbi:hypothetical protein Hanom_Chr12g01080341 [Helianthus anomalus]
MHPFNCGFIPARSSVDLNQSGNPTHPVSPVPTRPTSFGSGFLDYNQQNLGFMNLLNNRYHGTRISTGGTQIKTLTE